MWSVSLQLARRSSALVTALTSEAKVEAVKSLSADRVVTSGQDVVIVLRADSLDFVVDNVAGKGFSTMLKLLRCGGRFTSSVEIVRPIASLDIRNMYLKAISSIGTTA